MNELRPSRKCFTYSPLAQVGEGIFAPLKGEGKVGSMNRSKLQNYYLFETALTYFEVASSL